MKTYIGAFVTVEYSANTITSGMIGIDANNPEEAYGKMVSKLRSKYPINLRIEINTTIIELPFNTPMTKVTV